MLTSDDLDEKYDPKFSYLSQTKPYKSPNYEELISKQTKPTPALALGFEKEVEKGT